jgi:hypothetical protein
MVATLTFSLAMDKNGGAHIVYLDPELERVVYGYRD